MHNRRYETLDGLRGLCALIVAAMHFTGVLNVPGFLAHGGLSVEVFFVLSGFVIARAYEDRLKSGHKFGEFMTWRITRLIPTEVMGTLFGACAMAILCLTGDQPILDGFTPWIFLAGLMTALFLIPVWWTPLKPLYSNWAGIFPINPVLWSLQGEWFINIIYAKWLFRASTALIIALAFLSSMLLIYVDLQPIGFISTMDGLARACMGFLLGVGLYRIHNRGRLHRLPSVNPLIVYAVWFLIALVPPEVRLESIQEITASLVALVLVALLVRSERPMGRAWAFFGRISYPLYACHFGVAMFFKPFFGSGMHSLLWMLPYMAAAIVIAAGINRFAEMIGRALRSKS